MKIITIEARMTSTRLPGKVMLEAAGKPMLEHQINRLKQVKADKIVLATTTNTTDDCLVDLAKRLGIDYFRGSEEDVLGRVVEAGKEFKADTIIQTTGDCPVIDPCIVQQVYYSFLYNKCEHANNVMVRSYPDGMDTQVFNWEALEYSASLSTRPEHREHVGSYMRKYPEIFPMVCLVASPRLFYPELRLTLDYQEDYIRLKDIIEHFDTKFYCRAIIDYLEGKKNEEANSRIPN